MSYSITFSGIDGQGDYLEFFYLCAIGSWTLFSEWASKQKGASIHTLIKEGTCKGTDKLASQLLDLLSEMDLPDDSSIRATAEQLSERIGVGDPDETISIIDA